MSVKPIIPSIDLNQNAKKIKVNSQGQRPVHQNELKKASQVSFGGAPIKAPNVIVGLMDFIAAGGFAVSFIIQDGIGFITPRLGKGLLRGGKKKKDQNGNDILDKNGKPKRYLNWGNARKEFLRETITGPSAFVIPLVMLGVIKKKCGAGNNVRIDYLDSFKAPFANFVQNNLEAVRSGNAALEKGKFYQEAFKNVIDRSINSYLPESEKMSDDEITKISKKFAKKQIAIENVSADKSFSSRERKAKIAKMGSVVDDFVNLRKSKLGGNINELEVDVLSSDGSIKKGSIDKFINAMNDYFGDAVHGTKKALKENVSSEEISNAVKHFTNKRMCTRLLTNLGLFGVVAGFYTQIPKIYNMGFNGKNPAIADDEEEDVSRVANNKTNVSDNVKNKNSKDIPFGSRAQLFEKAGKVFNNRKVKYFSNWFELDGPVITGSAMATLLYGFCIPPRLNHAQDKYDYGEVAFRDMTCFTALLFGAKALARLFSDAFTKMTGLALNKKNMEGRSGLKKVVDYLSPMDKRHSVLSSGQLNSKYTHLENYKGRVNGFIDFIEQSGGDIKKAFAQDAKVKTVVEKIVKKALGKSYQDATVDDIKSALKAADIELLEQKAAGKALNALDKQKTQLIREFYNLFKKPNGLLNTAKTCNSTFGFLSTLVFVPGLIIWIGNVCEKMTEKARQKDKVKAQVNKLSPNFGASFVGKMSQAPSMAAFLGKQKAV